MSSYKAADHLLSFAKSFNLLFVSFRFVSGFVLKNGSQSPLLVQFSDLRQCTPAYYAGCFDRTGDTNLSFFFFSSQKKAFDENGLPLISMALICLTPGERDAVFLSRYVKGVSFLPYERGTFSVREVY